METVAAVNPVGGICLVKPFEFQLYNVPKLIYERANEKPTQGDLVYFAEKTGL